MSTVFISHNSADHDISEEVAQRLRRENHTSLFLDFDPEQGIVAGQSWEGTLYRKIRACRAVVAICTDAYLQSHWCFAEIALARMEGKPIFALKTDPLDVNAKLPSIMTENQFIDLRRDKEAGFSRLWRGLSQIDRIDVSTDWNPQDIPYRGLSSFQEKHAPVFFGREDESRMGVELLERGAPNFIMTIGASGSGKSSMVLAGILPRLRRDPDKWLIIEPFRPGASPYQELAEAFARSARRYDPSATQTAEGARDLSSRLRTWSANEESPNLKPDLANSDERVGKLIAQLEELRKEPPDGSETKFLRFLDWTIEDLQRICNDPVIGDPSARGSGATLLIDLALDLRRVAERPNAQILIVIDQFEELLNRENEAECQDFLKLLRVSAEAEYSPITIIGTMRSDFLGAFQRNPALVGVDFDSLSLGPVKAESIRRIITEPARMAEIELEPGLADRLIADMESADALPLLSFVLWVLWRNCRHDGRFDIAEYEQLGGLEGAIAREANALFEPEKESELARAFLHMTRLTEDGNYARRTTAWEDEPLRPVHEELERFVERRLLSSNEVDGVRTVEVAHEAMFRAWGPLKRWLERERAALVLRDEVARDAVSWEEQNRPSEQLWRGNRLLLAKDLMDDQKLDGIEHAFVTAGLNRRTLGRIAGIGTALCFLALVLGFSFWAIQERENALEAESKALELAEIAEAERNRAVAEEIRAQEQTRVARELLGKLVYPDFGRETKQLLAEGKIADFSDQPAALGLVRPAEHPDKDAWHVLFSVKAKPVIVTRALKAPQSGRIAAFGHDALLSQANETAPILESIFEWLNADKPSRQVHIGAGRDELLSQCNGDGRCQRTELVANLNRWDFKVDLLHGMLTDENLRNTDTLILSNANRYYCPQEIAAIQAFVERGGGLVMTELGWAWVQYGLPKDPSQLVSKFGCQVEDRERVGPIGQIGAVFGLIFPNEIAN